ncbi:hypothetical protein GCM10011501_03680 [Thalassotalea profundi]|uniref:DUF2189 domain-containing protein n=2 Tax=Thalassotalea profundi TaxID=2036687 RepID=A0ABQ3IHH1_9GAMM|nr:hypothetical protein GCM10011501_03680 [Thalassotalea profundi]
MSYVLLILSTIAILFIAELIRSYLIEYELGSMFISFCVGFILLTPLVSLLLYPLLLSSGLKQVPSPFYMMLKNIGLVLLVQLLFFFIWMTDAIAVYSIYVDQDSFLAKALNINNFRADLSQEFYWGNLILACVFSLISLVIGVLPCLVAQLNNQGVVRNFVISITFANHNKVLFVVYACILAAIIVLPLLYTPFLFLLCFPIAFRYVCCDLFHRYQEVLK